MEKETETKKMFLVFSFYSVFPFRFFFFFFRYPLAVLERRPRFGDKLLRYVGMYVEVGGMRNGT